MDWNEMDVFFFTCLGEELVNAMHSDDNLLRRKEAVRPITLSIKASNKGGGLVVVGKCCLLNHCTVLACNKAWMLRSCTRKSRNWLHIDWLHEFTGMKLHRPVTNTYTERDEYVHHKHYSIVWCAHLLSIDEKFQYWPTNKDIWCENLSANTYTCTINNFVLTFICSNVNKYFSKCYHCWYREINCIIHYISSIIQNWCFTSHLLYLY